MLKIYLARDNAGADWEEVEFLEFGKNQLGNMVIVFAWGNGLIGSYEVGSSDIRRGFVSSQGDLVIGGTANSWGDAHGS